MPREAAPSAPGGDGDITRDPAPSAPGGTEYPRGPAPAAPGDGDAEFVVQTDVTISTATGGEQFLVYWAIYNTGGTGGSTTVVLPKPVDLDEMFWKIQKTEGVWAASESTGLYGVGSINDTIHIPYGGVAVYVVGFRSQYMAPIGSSFTPTATIDGHTYSASLLVMDDHFRDSRMVIDTRLMLDNLLGLPDEIAGLPGNQHFQDIVNRGLRLHHLFEDVYERRGAPIAALESGRTVLSPATLGDSGPPERTLWSFSVATRSGGISSVPE